MIAPPASAESQRLETDARRETNWKRWGTYLSERQWGTVREDYSATGDAWTYLPHDHARSRAYRWGEDGLLGLCDRECRVCFAVALWNGRDPILKERLFGLSGPEGNHGEDVKEAYFYLDATPTGCYAKALYKYPQAPFPYARLVDENHRRGKGDPEFEILDTGIFDDNRYFDVFVEYAKASPNDVLIRITAANRGPDEATLHLLPTLWFRTTWSWGRAGEEGYGPKGTYTRDGGRALLADHPGLGRCRLAAEEAPAEILFTENESNAQRLFGTANPTPYVKDAFHRYLIAGEKDAVNPAGTGTKSALVYRLAVPAGGEAVLRLRLSLAEEAPAEAFGPGFDAVFAERIREADEHYAQLIPPGATADGVRVARQAAAGLLWSRQYYFYVVKDWLDGDPGQPPPPASRKAGRNAGWANLHSRDVISMPDKWEYPWWAAWDLAFHMLPFAKLDPEFAKEQLILMLREWYMHPNGQLPAYEWAFSDVNPPVHAWACWRVYKMSAPRGQRDRLFLERAFQKLLITFTWWVNRKDAEGNHLFAGGFLGLDNIGVFDRSRPLPGGATLEQADGTAWMAFFCTTMLAMALELARKDPAYEDVASKFFEHFIAISDAINALGGTGLWDEETGFYCDQMLAEVRRVEYVPGESHDGMFGGNSNWRGPVWFPGNYLLIEALERYHHFYRDTLQVECPTGSGRMMNLNAVAGELRRRLAALFLADAEGRRPVYGADGRFATDPHWKDLVLFYEYFHGDDGRGLGASHQTGWTALVSLILNDLGRKKP